MNKRDLVKKSLVNAAGVFVYISVVVGLLFNAKSIFGEPDPPGFLTPIFMLLLFVISASITGLLVLGKPIYLYLEGFKKDAFTLLFYTIAWLLFFLIIVGAVMLLAV